MNHSLVDDFLTAKDVLSKQPMCDYDIVSIEGRSDVEVNDSPVCLLHGGVPTGPYAWSWCDKVDPQIPLLRDALRALVGHMHLEVVSEQRAR